MTVLEGSVQVSTRVNASHVAVTEQAECVLLTTLQAAGMAQWDETVFERSSLNLVVCLDCSTSMKEEGRIDLCKKMLSFLVEDCLQEIDQFSLVTFAASSQVVVPPCRLTMAQRSSVLKKIAGITTGEHTNLSGGLFQALEVLHKDKLSWAPGTRFGTSAVLLLSDGEITSGILDRGKILRMTQNYLRLIDSSTPPLCYTFGYGSESDPVLQSLASETGGTFYHMTNVEQIPLAFGDAMGGLMHVAGQNIEILVELQGDGAQFVPNDKYALQHQFPREQLSSTAQRIRIRDLYLGEKRDILVSFQLSKLGERPARPSHVSVQVQVKYMDVIHECPKSIHLTRTIARPLLPVLSETDEQDQLDISRHMIRYEIAGALKRSKLLADNGDLRGGLSVIDTTIRQCQSRLEELDLDVLADEMLSCAMEDLQDARSDMDTMANHTAKASSATEASGAATANSTRRFAQRDLSRKMESSSWTHFSQRTHSSLKRESPYTTLPKEQASLGLAQRCTKE